MNRETRKQIVDKATARRQQVADEKNVEYTRGDEDSLDNFKRLGRKKNLDPVTILGVYLDKHLDSLDMFINSYVAESDPFKRRELAEQGEGIVSRLDDIRNYADILECLLFEAGAHPDSTQDTMPEIIRGNSHPIPVGGFPVKESTTGTWSPPTSFGQVIDPKQQAQAQQKGYDVV